MNSKITSLGSYARKRAEELLYMGGLNQWNYALKPMEDSEGDIVYRHFYEKRLPFSGLPQPILESLQRLLEELNIADDYVQFADKDGHAYMQIRERAFKEKLAPQLTLFGRNEGYQR